MKQQKNYSSLVIISLICVVCLLSCLLSTSASYADNGSCPKKLKININQIYLQDSPDSGTKKLQYAKTSATNYLKHSQGIFEEVDLVMAASSGPDCLYMNQFSRTPNNNSSEKLSGVVNVYTGAGISLKNNLMQLNIMKKFEEKDVLLLIEIPFKEISDDNIVFSEDNLKDIKIHATAGVKAAKINKSDSSETIEKDFEEQNFLGANEENGIKKDLSKVMELIPIGSGGEIVIKTK